MAGDFLKIMKERGFVHQCTDEDGLSAYLKPGGGVAYVGYDCTAKSLHVGSLVSIMMLRWFAKCGHKPIVLLGGGTTRIGDPSWRDEMRKPLSEEQIEDNMRGIRKVFDRLLPGGQVVNNAEWLEKISLFEYLSLGRHFSVNRMLTMDSVKSRLARDQEMSFLEFNYPVLQAYDFVELHKSYGCRLQMGGSDQWGNIVSGIELSRRLRAAEHQPPQPLFGLTTPLIATASGAKMGKTAAGAVWLDAEMLSPYGYWQFWRNAEDADVGRFLRLFTELPLEEIRKLETLEGAEINEAKIALANAAASLCHGEAAARQAAETARQVFEQGGAGEALPEITVARGELEAGIPAFKLLQLAGLSASGKEARQKIREQAARINGAAIADENRPITAADLTAAGHIKLSVGKKRHALVRPG